MSDSKKPTFVVGDANFPDSEVSFHVSEPKFYPIRSFPSKIDADMEHCSLIVARRPHNVMLHEVEHMWRQRHDQRVTVTDVDSQLDALKRASTHYQQERNQILGQAAVPTVIQEQDFAMTLLYEQLASVIKASDETRRQKFADYINNGTGTVKVLADTRGLLTAYTDCYSTQSAAFDKYIEDIARCVESLCAPASKDPETARKLEQAGQEYLASCRKFVQSW